MGRSDFLSRWQIEGLIANGQVIVITGNKVLRLDRWVARHPGGKLPILHMVGKDATDELQIYHHPDVLKKMDGFRIGYIDKPWVNFEPPISGGVFRKHKKEKEQKVSFERSPCRGTSPVNATLAFDAPPISENHNTFGYDIGTSDAPLSDPQKRMDHHSYASASLKNDNTTYTASEFIDRAERLEIESELNKYPAVDAATQANIVLKYRELHRKIEEQGYYDCRYIEYGKECIRYLTLLAICLTFLHYEWYITSAVFLGFFWQQIMFSAHDAGHMGITHNFVVDTLIGTFVADFCCGLSMGWWKSSHNVHHLVPNHPEHDPDIQNVPLFATSPSFFRSLRSSYYDFQFVWDKAANVLVGIQKYTYYPIMGIARFNLYLLSWLFLLSKKSRDPSSSWWTRPVEIIFMCCFWYLFGWLLIWKSIPTWGLRIAFVLVSHIAQMPLHIQITLSHFGMSSADLGPTESFAQKQLRTTMDVDCPAWLDFIHGGLQFQAVHHLFPRVPRHNLRSVQRLVREFCKDVGIEYTIYGFVDGNKVVLSRLGEISKQVTMLVACQKYMAETGESGLH